LTPDTAAKALASRFNRAPLVAARHETQLGIPPLPKPRRIIGLGPRRKLRSWEQCLTKSLRHDSAILSAAQNPSGSALESRHLNVKAALFAGRNHSPQRLLFRDSARPSHPSPRLGDTAEAVDVFAESCAWVGFARTDRMSLRIKDLRLASRAHDLLKKMTEE